MQEAEVINFRRGLLKISEKNEAGRGHFREQHALQQRFELQRIWTTLRAVSRGRNYHNDLDEHFRKYTQNSLKNQRPTFISWGGTILEEFYIKYVLGPVMLRDLNKWSATWRDVACARTSVEWFQDLAGNPSSWSASASWTDRRWSICQYVHYFSLSQGSRKPTMRTISAWWEDQRDPPIQNGNKLLRQCRQAAVYASGMRQAMEQAEIWQFADEWAFEKVHYTKCLGKVQVEGGWIRKSWMFLKKNNAQLVTRSTTATKLQI